MVTAADTNEEPAEQGGALAAVLAVVAILTALAGTILAVYVAQYRFVRRDVHRLQARYLAEACVYASLDRLQHEPAWRPEAAVLALPEGAACEVTVAGFGGYLLVRAVAQRRRSRHTARALVGEVPPAAFRRAIYLWDTQSSLNVAGTTRVRGDVVVGTRGLVESTFRGRRFRGRVEGPVVETPGLAPAGADLFVYAAAVDAFEAWLRPDAPAAARPDSVYVPARHLPRDNRVLHVAGDLHLTAADQERFDGPLTVAATGRLVVEGPLRFRPGTAFVAGTGLEVRGAVEGREGLFFGRTGVRVGSGVRCAGQFFSRASIRVEGDAYLVYPSVLYVTGEAAEHGGAVVLADSAVVDGVVVHPAPDPAPVLPRGRIVIGDSARVRGAVYNALQTELRGAVLGALVTYQLYFYETPTNYVNWLLDATVDVTQRPAAFALPVGFSAAPRLVVMAWEGHIEETAAPPPGGRHAARLLFGM